MVAELQRLIEYFSGASGTTAGNVGAEVETQFLDGNGDPVTLDVSRRIMGSLIGNEWQVGAFQNDFPSVLVDDHGNRLLHELGRHNIELATAPFATDDILAETRACLAQLYAAAEAQGAQPYFNSILPGDEDLIVLTDERDTEWRRLDGPDALAPLARISSVQFTVSVSLDDATTVLNRLGARMEEFLADFPQDRVWKEYIANSHAGYRPDRYGGPLHYDSIEDYVAKLTRQAVVQDGKLVPVEQVSDLDIPLYLRSVWQHFRLRRYGDTLCIEVRPLARREDTHLQTQLERVLAAF